MFSYAIVDEACKSKHNPVLEIGHFTVSIVHLRCAEVWDRVCLKVWDLWTMRTGMFSFLKMLVIL